MLRRILIASILIPAAALGQQWKLIAPMHHARGYPVTQVLNDGRILAAGGTGLLSGTEEATSEVYDTLTNTWTLTGNLNTKREKIDRAWAKQLDGRVFVAGGWINSTGTTLSSTEIFDPATNVWSYSTPLNEQTEGGCATLLLDGRIMYATGVVGGTYNYKTACEVYDPKTNLMNYTGSVSIAQGDNILITLPTTGHVIMISGHYNGAYGTWVNETEDYDPITGVWGVTAHSQAPHSAGPAVLLPDGRILAASGSSGTPIPGLVGNQSTPVIEIYDPVTKQWQFFGNLPIPRYSHSLIYIGGDSVLVAGGLDPVTGKSTADCEILNFRTGAITKGPTLNFSRSYYQLVSEHIQDACSETYRVYAIGGIGGFSGIVDQIDSALSSCEMIEFTHQASTTNTIRSIVHDISDVGDTAYIPLYLASNSGDAVQGIQFTAHYNTDLLSPIDPDFRGTLMENAQVWDQNQITGGMNFFAQQPFTISTSKPLVILKFKTYVTKEQCTSFIIDNLQLSFDSTGGKSDPCPLFVVGDSATICRTNACGEPTLRDFLGGKLPELRAVYDAPSDRIMIHDPIKGEHAVEVLNILGAVVKQSNVSGDDTYVETAGLPSGIYIVHVSDFEHMYSAKISIVR